MATTTIDYRSIYTTLVEQYCDARDGGDAGRADECLREILDVLEGKVRSLIARTPAGLRDGTKADEDFVQDVRVAVLEELARFDRADAAHFYHRVVVGNGALVKATIHAAQQQWVLPNVCSGREHKVLRTAFQARTDLRHRLDREPTRAEIHAETTRLAHLRAERNLTRQGKRVTGAAVEGYMRKDGTLAALRNLDELMDLEAGALASRRTDFADAALAGGQIDPALVVADIEVRAEESCVADLAGATLSDPEAMFVQEWSYAEGEGVRSVADRCGVSAPAGKAAVARAAAALASPVASFVAGMDGQLFEEEPVEAGLGARLALATAHLTF